MIRGGRGRHRGGITGRQAASQRAPLVTQQLLQLQHRELLGHGDFAQGHEDLSRRTGDATRSLGSTGDPCTGRVGSGVQGLERRGGTGGVDLDANHVLANLAARTHLKSEKQHYVFTK